MENSPTRSIWFWWINTTILYTVLQFFAGYSEELSQLIGSSSSGMLGQLSYFVVYLAGFVGLFVPYGLSSLLLFLGELSVVLSLISLVFFIVAMIYSDKKLNQKNLTTGKRILLNLFVLLLLTSAVDFIRGTPWKSWEIFLNGSANSTVHCC